FILLIFITKAVLPLYSFTKTNNITSRFLIKLISNKDLPIKSYQDRSNILILGFSGGNHEGSDLSDTMMVLSIDPVKKDILIISLPRDLWVSSLKAKINTAFHYGEEKKPGTGGMILAKATVSEIIGEPIQYGLGLDFSGFRKLIDLLDGVDINVEDTFEDDKFPIEGKENDFCGGDPAFNCRYEKISFIKGIQHMDAAVALKYVRSRFASGKEGTDFSRSKRQQQVIQAVREKIVHLSPLRDRQKIVDFIKTFNSTVTSDMNWSEKLSFARIFSTMNNKNLRHITLDTGDKKQNTKGYLINPPLWQYNGEWVLAPRSGDFNEIQSFVKCEIYDINCKMKP
ncbi:LCP family protein, partial [Candidatus Gottesmanbacteria bacterium]|nr:LCP family protein [Candidatus Gottesmanbacteria bacterium]